jgi:predicted histone-like DNA-binding protein
MALRIYVSQNENEKVGVVGNYYARVDNNPPIGIDELAEQIKEHNTGFSKGSIVGILKDMVDIIRHDVLSGQPVKIDDLAIFKASVQNKGGWTDLKDVSLRIGGKEDNIQAVKLVAQATGDFTRAELSKDGKLVLDRESARMVKVAGGNADMTDDDQDTDSSSSSDNGGNNGGGGTTNPPSGGDGNEGE